jgi:hypothetical protein
LRDGLGTFVEDGAFGEVEGAADLAQESGFLAVAFDQGKAESGGPILYGKSRETGTAANVEDVLHRVSGEELAGGEKRFAKVAGDHLLRGAQGCEIHVLVPAEQQVKMSLNGGDEWVIEIAGGNEGC